MEREEAVRYINMLLVGDVASKEIALALAEAIIRFRSGEDELKEQLPLKITDAKDRWLIEGSRAFKYDPESLSDPYWIFGPKIIEIAKSDCRVMRLETDSDVSVPPEMRPPDMITY